MITIHSLVPLDRPAARPVLAASTPRIDDAATAAIDADDPTLRGLRPLPTVTVAVTTTTRRPTRSRRLRSTAARWRGQRRPQASRRNRAAKRRAARRTVRRWLRRRRAATAYRLNRSMRALRDRGWHLALRALDRLPRVRRAQHDERWLRHVDRCLAGGRHEAALTAMLALLRRRPGDAGLQHRVADVLLRCGQPARAAAVLARLADDYASDGFDRRAIALYRQVLRRAPSSPIAHDARCALARLLAAG
ncbi:MAG: hypothetical protein AAF772_16950 [Acidobacteriota bacterium]